MEQKKEKKWKEMSKAEKFAVLWVISCYFGMQVIFFGSLYLFSTIIANANPTVTGRPMEEAGMVVLAFKFICEPVLIKLNNNLIKNQPINQNQQ
jgi:hypothetical protein